jgi:phage regulator Rha-like protein
MDEREFSSNHIAEVIETKLDQLIHSVQEIKEQMHDNSVDISNLKLDLNTLKNATVTQDEKIAELKKHYEVNKNMIMGVAMTVVTAIVVAILKNIGLSI